VKKYLEFAWRLFLTPFYLTAISVASVFVYLADGLDEFKKFWSTNT
jgi:hypothetical protein